MAADLPEVTVKARRDRPSFGEPSTVLALTSGAIGVSEAVGQIPTATVRKRGENDWELPSLRGEASTQNRWFLESTPLTSSAFGLSQAHLVPPEALATLEVFAGGVPALFVEDGLGGAFSMRLNWPEKNVVNAGIRYGSFGSRRVAVQGGNSTGSINLVYHQGDENYSYRNSNGTPFNYTDDFEKVRTNASFSRLTLLPRVQWDFGKFKLRSYALYSQGASQIPGPTLAPDGGTLYDRYVLASTEARVSAQTKVFIFGSFDSQVYNSGGQSGTGPLKTVDKRLGAGGRTQLTDKWDMAVQPQWEWMEMTSVLSNSAQTKWWVPVGTTLDAEIFGLQMNPEVVYHHVEYPGVGNRFDLISFRVGLSQPGRDQTEPGRRSSLTLGNYFRHPTMAELYGQPQVLAGNASLVPERSFKAEAAFSRKLGGIVASFTHFQSLSMDVIVNSQNAQGLITSSNIGKAWIWGTIAEAKVRRGVWDGSLSASQLYTENLSEIPSQAGKSLPFRPNIELKSLLGWSPAPLSIKVSHTLYGPMYQDPSNRQQMLTTQSLDLNLSLKTRRWGDWVIELSNLLDSVLATRVVGDYRFDDPTTGLAGYPASGRRISLSWRMQL